MPGAINKGAVRWLRGQLPELVASGVISSENARAIERHYESAEAKPSFGFVLLAGIGSALVGAGIVLLVAHNWDQLGRVTRTAIAFLPLILAQLLGIFVLFRRTESRPWRESAAIFDMAAAATTISLVSQTYQIQGSFADFMVLWLLLTIGVVYLFRTIFGAVGYIAGTVAWLMARDSTWAGHRGPTLFWLFLALLLPYFIWSIARDRTSRETAVLSVFLLLAAAIGLGFSAESAQAGIGGIAFAGFFAAAYLAGMKLSDDFAKHVPAAALLSGIGIGVTTIVLSFKETWHPHTFSSVADNSAPAVGVGIQLFFPVVAIALLIWDFLKKRRIAFSVAIAVAPLVAGLAWLVCNADPEPNRGSDSPYSLAAAVIINIYALVLGAELIARGTRANSFVRANFGLLVIAALAIARFFDSDLGFVTRGLGFIVVGTMFLVANWSFFRRQAAK